MKMAFTMLSGKKHKVDIGNSLQRDPDFPSRLRKAMSDEMDGFLNAYCKIDGVLHTQALLKVDEIESVTFE